MRMVHLQARSHAGAARMLAAASMGATAFQKGLGAVHSISHPVGAIYDTHHGMTNGVVMPYVLAFNRGAIEDKLERIGRTLELPGQGFPAVFDWLLALRRDLYIPHSLAELGVTEDRLAELAVKAEADPSTGSNAKPVKADDLRAVFVDAVNGRL